MDKGQIFLGELLLSGDNNPNTITNQNTASGAQSALKVWEGTQAQYNALAIKYTDTIYFVNEAPTVAVPFTLDSMPVGYTQPWWTDTAPSSKYLFMEGQDLTSYPLAQAVFGSTLPDLRGRVMVHKSVADGEFDTMKKTGGHKDIQAHTHPIDTYTYVNGSKVAAPAFAGNWALGDHIATGSTGTGNSGNLQPYIVCRWIAKVLA